jgi:DNA-binding response OmpR family regulator
MRGGEIVRLRGISDRPRASRWALGPAERDPVVLIIEPDEDTRDFMRILFETRGFAVEECIEGDRVVAAVERLRPDLIVLEERLPGTDGRTVCRQLRSAAEDIRHTPIIFVSASSAPSSESLALEAGCTRFFLKPFDIFQLMAAATELVSRLHALH